MQQTINTTSEQKEMRKCQIKCIISCLLLTIAPISFFCNYTFAELNNHTREMLTYDNRVNTISEMWQYKRMSTEEKHNLCMQYLAPIKEQAELYENCSLRVYTDLYTYDLYRDGNIAVGAIEANYEEYPVYCEKQENNTIVRIFKDNVWYEKIFSNEQIVDINQELLTGLVDSVQWNKAYASYSITDNPGVDTSTIFIVDQTKQYVIQRLPCEHLFKIKMPGSVINFKSLSNGSYKLPDFTNATIESIDDIASILPPEKEPFQGY